MASADSLAYTTNMTSRTRQATNPCLCDSLRQASRAVTRVYDQEMRTVGLRTTQYALLAWLGVAGEVRQRNLVGLTFLDETTLTRNFRPLIGAGWVAVSAGKDRREKRVRLTATGAAKLRQARPAWDRAQRRMRSRLPKSAWATLMGLLPELTRLADKD
jgi:DNA-binding MarR family transcriptional regulator